MPICVCLSCSQKVWVKNGQQQPGQDVSTSTRLAHERRDAFAKIKAESGLLDETANVKQKPRKEFTSEGPSTMDFQQGMWQTLF